MPNPAYHTRTSTNRLDRALWLSYGALVVWLALRWLGMP